MDPITATVMLVSTAVSAGSKVANGYAQASQYKSEAALAERQAQDVDLQAKQASEARRSDLQAGLSAIAARRAAAGVGLDSPSAQAIEANYVSQSQRAENIDAIGYNNQKASLMTQAAMRRKAAKSAITQGWLSAASSAVSGFGNLAGSGAFGGGGGMSPTGGTGFNTDGFY